MKTARIEYQAFLASANAFSATQKQLGITFSPELVRLGLDAFNKFALPKVDVNQVSDSFVINDGHSIPVRIYDPKPDKMKPVIVFFHGGGHICGTIDLYDPITRRLASTTDHLVISVAYRLSPEFRYPKGIEDSQSVINQLESLLKEHSVDLKRVSLAGDSAGGTVATTIALANKADTFSSLILFYPNLDYTFSTPSYETYGTGYLLETEKIHWYYEQYFTAQDNRLAASPLFSANISNLPPTLLMAAELDPLVDEGKLFRDKLNAAGIPCEYHMGEQLIHTFLNLEVLNPKLIDETYQTVANFLNKHS